MGSQAKRVPHGVMSQLKDGAVIPAHPLVLDSNYQIDRKRQRAITRYYVDAGVGGIAIGVHTTQFAIREAGLFEPVLRLTSQVMDDWSDRELAKIAGVTGGTEQALAEATVARELGYHAVLLNVARFANEPEERVLEHCRRVAEVTPIIGFALLPEVGGFHLSYDFWREFCEIDNVIAIKMAPFNRYRTLDIVRAVVESGRENDITLYTGNDDHIVLDLLSPFVIATGPGGGEQRSVQIQGGLLGHWSVWAHRAVRMLEEIKQARAQTAIPRNMLALDSIVTQMNAAVYDAINDFRGAIPGCLEVLRRQGFVEEVRCLDPEEQLSAGQYDEITRVHAAFPAENDDEFVATNLKRWLADDGKEIPLTEMD